MVVPLVDFDIAGTDEKTTQAQLVSSGQISNLKAERAVVGLIVIELSAFLKYSERSKQDTGQKDAKSGVSRISELSPVNPSN